MEENQNNKKSTGLLGACDIDVIVSAVRARLEREAIESNDLHVNRDSENNDNAANIAVKLGAGGVEEVVNVVCARLKRSGVKI